MAKQVLIILLVLDAGWVAIRQYRYGDRNAGLTWALIVAYWVILTIKNMLDWGTK